jgi:hypothetical protein
MNSHYHKYPRTPHLPWSQGNTSDDKVLKNTTHFEGKEIVITEKMDGENTSMYHDYIHARSIDGRQHVSREWVKRLHAEICHLIPAEWRLCGENVYARHSIAYDNLDSYFYLFSIWTEHNICLDWQQTLEWAELLNLKTPKVLYVGPWNEKLISNLSIDTSQSEGYVVRISSGFPYASFDQNVAKWVRKMHVTTDSHWMHQKIVPNRLARIAT